MNSQDHKIVYGWISYKVSNFSNPWSMDNEQEFKRYILENFGIKITEKRFDRLWCFLFDDAQFEIMKLFSNSGFSALSDPSEKWLINKIKKRQS